MNSELESRAASGFTRRQVLGGATALAGAALLGAKTAALPLRPGGGGSARPVLVQVFLRGAMDGLTTVVPHGDPDYYSARPNVAVPPPGEWNGALDLDGFFGLAPAAAPLSTPYANGHLAFVHATGSPALTRSHSEANRYMEIGDPGLPPGTLSDSWIARYLGATASQTTGVLRGVGAGFVLPLSLRGAEQSVLAPLPENVLFPGAAGTAGLRAALLAQAYGAVAAPVGPAGLDTLASVALLSAVDFPGYVPANGAVYPDTALGEQLCSVATLIKADIGVEVITLDHHGWDLHADLGPATGTMATLLDDLARSLHAFYVDLGAMLDRCVLVCMTEFGRRVAENSSLGLDHGTGSAMLVMGTGIQGGRVVSDWPGLAPTALDQGGLAITIDYRDVLGEILDRRFGVDPAAIFPQHVFTPHGVAF
jgi:uncharacterized protein (DUF1501 family)